MLKNTHKTYTKLHRVGTKCGSYKASKTTDRNLFHYQSCNDLLGRYFTLKCIITEMRKNLIR
jgi:hypothetical protein